LYVVIKLPFPIFPNNGCLVILGFINILILFLIYLLPFVIVEEALTLRDVIREGDSSVTVLIFDEINAFSIRLCLLLLDKMFEQHIADFIF
jgi:hypothetical protein